MNVQNIVLDLSKQTMAGQIVRMGQGDSDGTTIVATIYDHSVPADISECTAAFCMRLPDKRSYVRDNDCDIDENVITYVVDEEHCCVKSGYTDDAYFEIYDGSETYSTSRFRVKVFPCAYEGTEPAPSWDNALQEAVNAALDAASSANSAAESASDAESGIESALSEAVSSAADELASAVESRVDDAIGAIGDISELAVPLMSSDVRGGAKLGSGLEMSDGFLSVVAMTAEEVHAITGTSG